jgi:hypothetical protein
MVKKHAIEVRAVDIERTVNDIQAGLRNFRFHDLRHTFGSLLIQRGVSPAYVQKQMGHKSIHVTIDVYGHLSPGENVAWIDTLDCIPRNSRSRTHTGRTRRAGNQRKGFQAVCKIQKPKKLFGCPQGSEPRYADPEART